MYLSVYRLMTGRLPHKKYKLDSHGLSQRVNSIEIYTQGDVCYQRVPMRLTTSLRLLLYRTTPEG